MSIHGIDVSGFQGSIDWEAVRARQIQFAMIRAGYGEGTVDQEFRRNAIQCNQVGLPFGVYWFSYAYIPEMARQEANDRGRTTAPERHSQSQPDLCGNYDQSMRGRRENWPGIQILEAGPFFIIS